MHSNWRPGRSDAADNGSRLIQQFKCSTYVAVALIGVAVTYIQSASSQEHPLLNTPPILVVPERNWRISESETVGQIISRIRADDSENDELIFGLESQSQQTNVPFRIDPIGGVVYLNESLIGRGGQNFFLYITVTDGQLKAKNEVFVNILSAKDGKHRGSRPPPSISNTIYNISHFLPPFDRLPGVQSVRNREPSQGSSHILPPGFGQSYSPVQSYNPLQHGASWPTNNITTSSEGQIKEYNTDLDHNNLLLTNATSPQSVPANINRTKLTPIELPEGATLPSVKNVTTSGNRSKSGTVQPADGATIPYNFSSHITPIVLICCALFILVALVVGFWYRKRLCAIGKTLKKKSKEEMAKKSNQSNISSVNLTDDSRNSMVLQQWNGPTAYGNRYVPWERDQPQQQHQHQILQTSIVTSLNSVNAATGRATNNCISTAGVIGGPPTCSGGLNGSTSNHLGEFDQWEFPRHRLKFFHILGEGAFGQVWRCEATDIDGDEGVTTVAVKTLKENASEAEKKDLLSELEVMKSLESHVNVVRFLGCCTDKDPIFVIIEYVNRGKLQTYLRNSRAERHYRNTYGKSNILTSGDLTLFMYQVARGMDYLTSRGIIHRDLAARNVLITEDRTCKVADFGFARDVVTSKIYERKSEGKLPIRWMAIESLYDNIFSVKSDIWSFGVLMWEIVTLGSTPYPGISASDVMRKVRDEYRLEKPEHCRRELYNIMYYCWSLDPNDRPSFAELVDMLDKLLHTEMDYIELERFPDHNYYNIINLSGEKV